MLHQFLDQSQATAAFREAVAHFLRTGQPSSAIQFSSRLPPVKIERALTKIIETYPDLSLERVEIDGTSGCEFFRGTATLSAGGEQRRVEFNWDCRWKAMQVGWTDYFGLPDQIRAAREFGYDCFRVWTEQQAAAYSP
ncbi:hypothetical protein BH23GEM7_BH23GEM7_38130 [soil metagenome]